MHTLVTIITVAAICIQSTYQHFFDIVRAPAPLFRGEIVRMFKHKIVVLLMLFVTDPVYDGAADPTVIFDSLNQVWVLFYTQRKASDISLQNRSW